MLHPHKVTPEDYLEALNRHRHKNTGHGLTAAEAAHARRHHRLCVECTLSAGHPIPSVVLASYPDLEGRLAFEIGFATVGPSLSL